MTTLSSLQAIFNLKNDHPIISLSSLQAIFNLKNDPIISLSSLQAIFNLKNDHPILVQILERYMNLTRDGKKTVFVWVPGHWALADSAAKDALVGDISVELIPFSDLKKRANIYYNCGSVSGMSSRKIHQIFPTLKDCTVCSRTNGKEETVIARLRIGHSFITHSFLLKGEEPPVCIGCDKRLTIEHILYLFGFY